MDMPTLFGVGRRLQLQTVPMYHTTARSAQCRWCLPFKTRIQHQRIRGCDTLFRNAHCVWSVLPPSWIVARWTGLCRLRCFPTAHWTGSWPPLVLQEADDNIWERRVSVDPMNWNTWSDDQMNQIVTEPVKNLCHHEVAKCNIVQFVRLFIHKSKIEKT